MFKNFARLLLSIFLLLSVSTASAALIWSASTHTSCVGANPTVVGQCVGAALAAGGWHYDHYTMTGTFTADVYSMYSDGHSLTHEAISASGSCAAGSTYNSATGVCNQSCSVAGQVNSPVDGSCSCPSATPDIVNNACVAPCAANQMRNPTTGVCEGPCTASQYAAAVASVSDPLHQDHVTISQFKISSGLRTINESTTTSYYCTNTCKSTHVIYVRIGTVTSTGYEIKDWMHDSVEQVGCDNLPAGSTQTTAVVIGQKPDGGCRPGFVYGEVNNVAGCYGTGTPTSSGIGGAVGAPNSGASQGGGGGGPQNNPGNPGGADGAGNNGQGQNQNGNGGACAPGYHDLNGTCVKDVSVGGGGSGAGTGPCDPSSKDYLTCIGEVSSAPDADGSALADVALGKAKPFLDTAETTIKDAIQNRAQPIQPDGPLATLKAIFPQNNNCSDFGFTYFGATFTITCPETQTYRDWAAFALAFLTVIECFRIAFVKGA